MIKSNIAEIFGLFSWSCKRYAVAGVQILPFMLSIVMQVEALVYRQGLPFMFTSTQHALHLGHTNSNDGVRPLVC